MQSLFDVITSVIVAGMVMISMFTALLAMQAQSFNSQIYMNMENNTAEIVRIIKNYYLGSVGVGTTSAPIITATTTQFRFRTFIDPGTGTATSTDVSIEERTISGKKSIWIYRNNNYNQKLFGPFDLSADGLTFTYYGVRPPIPPEILPKEVKIMQPNIAAGRDSIKSVEMNINFAREGLNFRTNTPLYITNHIVIWKYFEKLYY